MSVTNFIFIILSYNCQVRPGFFAQSAVILMPFIMKVVNI